MKVGALSDSHDDLCDWAEVLPKIEAAFAGVDLILHCGDISRLQAIDDLERIAPVRATRSDGDPPAEPPRLSDGPTVVDAGGTAVLLAFQRPENEQVPDGVGVVVFGGTHAAAIESDGGVLWVNPGSPSLSKATSVAVLTLGDGRPATAEIIPL